MPDSRTFLVALALFSVSTITSAVCYARVQLERSSSEEILDEIPAGQSHYALSNNGICFGTFSLSTQEKIGEVTIDGRGAMAVQWQGEVISLAAELHAEFNALRQLGGSFLNLTAGDNTLQVSTLNVRPIAVKARWKMNGETRGAETSVPGPILVRKTAHGGYLIRGDLREDSRQKIELLATQPVLRAFAVNSRQPSELLSLCPGDAAHVLNLDPIGIFLRGIGNSLPISPP